MGEQDSSGNADNSSTAGYKFQTLSILNILCGELYPLSDTYVVATAGTRPVCTPLLTLNDNIPLDDTLAVTLLPYGLAAHLFLIDDEASKAGYFQQRYEELKARFTNPPSEFAAIEDIYGGVENGEFGEWS
jgi:hypothetical protein